MRPTERSLATILFTDIVGSTERATELGDRAWRTLLEKHHALVRRELRRFGGREAGTAGDGFLALFERPARAIVCAGVIRDSVREAGLEVRCGVHMGEVEVMEKTVGGIGVHIAARVMGEAEPGEVLVSRSVRDAVEGAGFGFVDRGARALKGVAGGWRVFAVAGMPTVADERRPGKWPPVVTRRRVVLGGAFLGSLILGLTALNVVRRDGPTLNPEEVLAVGADPGIAVVPFTVRGAGLDLWREGMVDVLSTNLDGSVGLRTIDSRTVLARWREGVQGDSLPDLTVALDVARRTGARYALVGDAVASGSGVRFGADIYDVRKEAKLGEVQVEGSPDSLFTLVDRLAIEILRAIHKEGSPEIPSVQGRLSAISTTSLRALKSYLAGEILLRKGEYRAAVGAYERAIKADSTFALAILSRCEARGWTPEWCSDEEWDTVFEVVDQLPARDSLLLVISDWRRLQHLDSLRSAVQRYPDDPDFWFALGDTYFHMSDYVLVDLDEVERVFSRALALDPGFTAFYQHPMELAFWQADSARIASLIQAYAGTGYADASGHRTVFSLAFGDPTDRSRALASLDMEPFRPALWTGGYLIHARFLPIQEQVARRVLARPDALPYARSYLYYNLLQQGRLREALEYLEESPWPGSGPREAYLYLRFMPDSDTIPQSIDRYLSGPFGTGGTVGEVPADMRWRRDFFSGTYAADRARWPAHKEAIGRLRAEAGELVATGDSVLARDHAVAARALEAYGLWKRGRGTQALPLLEAAFHEVAAPNQMIKWWLGELSLELGRPREAAVYFASIWGYASGAGALKPMAALRLGEIYAGLGEFEKARQSYEYALMAWQEADPEMRPRVAVAQRALAELD